MRQDEVKAFKEKEHVHFACIILVLSRQRKSEDYNNEYFIEPLDIFYIYIID